MGSVLVEAVEPGCPLPPGAEETLLGVAALLGSVLTSRAQQGRQGAGARGTSAPTGPAWNGHLRHNHQLLWPQRRQDGSLPATVALNGELPRAHSSPTSNVVTPSTNCSM